MSKASINHEQTILNLTLVISYVEIEIIQSTKPMIYCALLLHNKLRALHIEVSALYMGQT